MVKLSLSASHGLPPLELWGGVECTINRVQNRFCDQFVETGHIERAGDIDLIADIGFAAVRYPISWERIAPERADARNWRWTDDRLSCLRRRGIRIIAGLVHHGSGPAYTSLLDDGFAVGLGQHACSVAERYPWIDDWTPVNEPLTTARFSGLYGHWYPHRQSEAAFWRALLNQIDATRVAMRAIRKHNALARLIQTEDVGRTYATSPLADQAAFDNARRWMSLDLLCGLVVPGHVLWNRIDGLGLGNRLRAIADDPCPPDIIGINHYLTSDRFLDHRIRNYDGIARAENDRQIYVDTEAARVLSPPAFGLSRALDETWRRYGRPLALTEVHNGCTREDQLRWTADAWETAHNARCEGIDVRAVTSWSLFGSSGWNTLLTAPGRYESGAFDVTSSPPRATALVPVLKALARGEDPQHPILAGKGWWKREIRLHHQPVPHRGSLAEHRTAWHPCSSLARPILVVGATGSLGKELAAACQHRDIAHHATDREELHLSDEMSINSVLELYAPWAVINAAGWVRVDDAELAEGVCFEANTSGAVRLARACAARGIPTVSFSSDLVFDGQARNPYDEQAPPSPLNAYGRSKAEAERQIAELDGDHLIVRTAAFFSPFNRHNFGIHTFEALSRGEPFSAASDQIVTPTYLPDLCNAVLDLVIDGETGLWHLTNEEPCTWVDFARRIAAATGLCAGLVAEQPGAALGQMALRPSFTALTSRRGRLLPSLENAIERFARDLV